MTLLATLGLTVDAIAARRTAIGKHYNIKPARVDDLIRAFDVKAIIQPNGCWEWSGARDKNGYGKHGINGLTLRAHRFALEVATGPMPADLYACHTCDNPPCCNPAHLWRGSNGDNHADAAQKGRRAGEKNARAKLSNADAQEAARRIASGERPKAFASEYGVHWATLYRAARRETRNAA